MVLKLQYKNVKRSDPDMFIWGSVIAFYVSMSIATISFQQSGWLDRVVQYHKNRFLNDLQTLPRVEIKASIKRAPYGYEDPDTWDLDSALRLLGLLQYSNEAAPVFQYLRRSMQGRRFMKYADTFKAFPSLAKNHPNYFYYDVFSEELDLEATTLFEEITDDSIIVVSNPAEARLPAAQISVRLLKEILEARAVAARYMPTSLVTIYWKPMNKTKSAVTGGTATGGGETRDASTAGGATGGLTQPSAAAANATQSSNSTTPKPTTPKPS